MWHVILKQDLKSIGFDLSNLSNSFVFFISSIILFYFGFESYVKANHYLASCLVFVILIFSLNLNSISFMRDDFNNGILAQYILANIQSYEIIIAKFCLFFLLTLPMVFLASLGFYMFGMGFEDIINCCLIFLAIIPLLSAIIFTQIILTLPLYNKSMLIFVLTFPISIPFMILTLIALDSYFRNDFVNLFSQLENILYFSLILIPILFFINKIALNNIIKS